MGFYDKHLLPQLVHFTCGLKPAMKQRAKVVPLARGRVLQSSRRRPLSVRQDAPIPYDDRTQRTQLGARTT